MTTDKPAAPPESSGPLMNIALEIAEEIKDDCSDMEWRNYAAEIIADRILSFVAAREAAASERMREMCANLFSDDAILSGITVQCAIRALPPAGADALKPQDSQAEKI